MAEPDGPAADPLADAPDNLIEIHDPEIDPQALMAEIRRRLRQRREELGYDRRVFPTFGATVPMPEPPADIKHAPNLYHHLRQANKLYGDAETTPVLAASPATRVPVLGPLWRLIRAQAHGLVLFYVNRAVAQQFSVNRYLVNVLNELTAASQEQQRTIERLESELERLRQAQAK
jgi:hypothetical protein